MNLRQKIVVYELLCLEDRPLYASTIASIVLGVGLERDTQGPIPKYLVTSYSLRYNPISYQQACIQPFVWSDVGLSIAKVKGQMITSVTVHIIHPQRD